MNINQLHIVSLLLVLYAFSTCVRSREGRLQQRAVQIEHSIKQDVADIYEGEYNTVIKMEYDLLVVNMPSHIPSQILERVSYISSYNNKTLNPNWVAWHLTSNHTDGPYRRNGVPYYSEDGTVYGIGRITEETSRNSYFVDLESKEPRQKLSDWTREYNMSHGHMCPAADNKWDKAAMNQSFLLTNMCPQDEKLNGAGWARLEDKCRSWANKYGDIYIVTGPIFNDPISRTIGEGKMAVPDAFFKVILCLVDCPKAIGFVYRNDSSSQSYKENVCSVDEIEDLTGFDFFYSLPDEVQDSIEDDTDLKKWD